MSRRVLFDDESGLSYEPQFGNYTLMYYYAHTVDTDNANELLSVIIPKENHLMERGLPRVGIEESAEYTVTYDLVRFNLVLDFINDILIPSLDVMDPQTNLLDSFGGKVKMEHEINTSHTFGVFDEYYDTEPGSLIGNYEFLKGFIAYAIETGVPYRVVY